jgi:NhaP-type Na+/H+ or K+/H+ antiporter
MVTVLVFAFTLVTAVLISGLAARSVLSTAVLFLMVGFAAGGAAFDFIPLRPGDPVVERLVEITLFAVLFTDGMLVGFRDLIGARRLPGRAVLLGFPLTLGAVALLARFVAGIPWLPSLLLGAILAPTDPVFASALVGREEIPSRVRRLLNVESGLNDGLALPIVLILLGSAGRDGAGPARP